MPDPMPNIGESPEHIAFRLFEMVVDIDGQKLKSSNQLTGDWVLSTYARCLATVKNPKPGMPKISDEALARSARK